MEIESTDTAVKRCTQALIDCGATGCFIDIKWAKLNNVPTRPLSKPIPVYNVDGTANNAGAITDIADIILRYENHSERTQLAVIYLGKQSLILGYNWLRNHNPEINWQTKDSRCLAAHYNVPLVELKISVMRRFGSQRLPRSMHAS
jgi:predicted aspartyl protease